MMRNPENAGEGDSAAAARGTLTEPEFQFPTTLAQQALWYLDRLEPGNPAWNIAVRFRIRGDLDIGVLEAAINKIVQRHEILRTTFTVVEGEPVQVVHNIGKVSLPMNDLSAMPQGSRSTEEERLTIREGEQPFDLKTGPLLRAFVLRLGSREHMLLVTMHHIVSDGWSIGVFSDELAAFYEAGVERAAAALPDLALQYADYTVWQNERAAKGSLDEHRAYWRSKLANLPPCEIPPDYPRPPLKTHNGYILSVLLPRTLTEGLANFSRRQGCTLFVTALAVLKALISRYSGQTDVYAGTLVAGRDRAELEPLIGVFINTIVLRTDLSGDPKFVELLDRVRRSYEEGLAHQDLHFQQVVELLRPKRDLSRPTLYEINFIYQRDFVKPQEFAGLTMTAVPSKSPGAIYDLNFFMVERADGWRLSCEYNCDLYAAETVNRMLGQLRGLFEQIAENPDRRLSEFEYPASAGDPLPAFVPRRTGFPSPEHTETVSAMTPTNGKSSSGMWSKLRGALSHPRHN